MKIKVILIASLLFGALLLSGYNWVDRSVYNFNYVGVVKVNAQSCIGEAGITSETQAKAQVKMALSYLDFCGTNVRWRIDSTPASTCDDKTVCCEYMPGGEFAYTWSGYAWDPLYNAVMTHYWMIKMNTEVNYWGNYDYNDFNGVSFYTTLTHEFGHTLGMYDGGLTDYPHDLFGPFIPAEALTEDGCHGIISTAYQAPIIKYPHFRIGVLDSVYTGNFAWLAHLTFTDPSWYSIVTPAITGNRNGSSTGDLIVTWVHPSSLQVNFAVLDHTSGEQLLPSRGPTQIANSYTWNQPSVTAYGNEFVIAIRDDWPDNDLKERQGRIKMYYFDSLTDTTPTAVYPKCGAGANDWCKTLATPKIAYNASRDRWILAWVQSSGAVWNEEEERYDGEWDGKHEIRFMISAQGDPTVWSTNYVAYKSVRGFPTDKYGSVLGLAINCDDTGYNNDSCMVVYNNFNDNNIWEQWEVAVQISALGVISYISSSQRWLSDANYGDRDVIASPYGWLVSTSPSMTANCNDFWYRFKRDSQGIAGNWNFQNKYVTTYCAYRGFDLGYSWVEDHYILSWID